MFPPSYHVESLLLRTELVCQIHWAANSSQGGGVQTFMFPTPSKPGAEQEGTPSPPGTLGRLNYSPPLQKWAEAKFLSLDLFQQKGFCVGRPSREHSPKKIILQNRKQSCNTLLRLWVSSKRNTLFINQECSFFFCMFQGIYEQQWKVILHALKQPCRRACLSASSPNTGILFHLCKD